MGGDVDRLEYSPLQKTGFLHMAKGHVCDMTACIEFFKSIDPDVRSIGTFSGKKRVKAYLLVDGEWCALEDGRK
jgi:hypothetical protein